MRWPLQPLQPFQQTQLQPPFGQSVDSLCHPWFTTTNVSYRFPILKLPPPPRAVLLVILISFLWIVIFANVNGLFHCAAIQFDGVPSCPCLRILVKWQCWFPTAPSNPFISFVLFLQYSHPKSAQQSNQFGWFTTDHIYPSDLSWIVLHYVELYMCMYIYIYTYIYIYIDMEVLLGVVRENGQRCSKAITRNLFELAIQHDFFRLQKLRAPHRCLCDLGGAFNLSFGSANSLSAESTAVRRSTQPTKHHGLP